MRHEGFRQSYFQETDKVKLGQDVALKTVFSPVGMCTCQDFDTCFGKSLALYTKEDHTDCFKMLNYVYADF